MAYDVIKISELPESSDYGNLYTIGTLDDGQGNVTSKKVPLAVLGKAGTAVQGVKVNGTEQQKDAQNKVNIVVPEPQGAVRYDTAQTLTDQQKEQARENIGIQSILEKLKVIPFSITGKYLNTTGVETDWYDGCCTDFFSAELMDIFYFSGPNHTVSTRVVGYDSSKAFVKVLHTGAADNLPIQIDDATIKYVRASSRISEQKSFSKYNAHSIPELEEKLQVYDGAIFSDIDDNLTSGGQSGYIKTDGTKITPYSGYEYKECELKAGAEIKLKSYLLTNMAAISKKNTDGSYTPLVIPQSSDLFKVSTYEYELQENATIAINYGTEAEKHFESHTLIPISNSKQINNLQKAISDFRFLRTVNLTEDASEILITNDSDGNAIACKEMVVLMQFVPENVNLNWAYIQLSSGYYPRVNLSKLVDASTNTHYRVYLSANGVAHSMVYSHTNDWGNASSVVASDLAFSDLAFTGLTKFHLVAPSNKSFLAGTIIKIYGR